MVDYNLIIERLTKANSRLSREEIAAFERLVDAYTRIHQRLQDKIDALVLQIAENPEGMSINSLYRLERFKSLIQQAKAELEKFQVIAINEVERIGALGAAQGVKDGQALLKDTARLAGVSGAFNVLPSSAIIEQLLDFLRPDGPLYARLGQLANATAERVANTIVEGVGLGYNPRKIAREITNSLGMGLTDAMRNVRTVQLYSYREASRAQYVSNSDVVRGWVWYAEFDDRVCGSCLAMHGTVHSLDENLDDHYNGRCAMLPLLAGQENPVPEGGQGEQWFRNQPEGAQKQILGAGRWQALQDGKYQFSDLPVQRESDVYGHMRSVKTLRELIGDADAAENDD